jgi:hypothetical protein
VWLVFRWQWRDFFSVAVQGAAATLVVLAVLKQPGSAQALVKFGSVARGRAPHPQERHGAAAALTGICQAKCKRRDRFHTLTGAGLVSVAKPRSPRGPMTVARR